RFAAFGPTRSGSLASSEVSGIRISQDELMTRSPVRTGPSSPRKRGPMNTGRAKWIDQWSWVPTRGRYAALAGTTGTDCASSHVVAVAGQRIDNRDLLDREIGNDLDPIRMHDQHLLDAHAPAEAVAVLGLEREHHAGLDLDRMVERPDAGDDRLIVLREPQSVAPEIGRGLVLLGVTPGFLRRGPFRGDFARRRADAHRVDRIVEPFERGRVNVLLLLGRLLAHAIRAVVAGLVAVPGQRREVHEHDVARLDDAIGEIAPVGPGVRTRRDDHVLDVLHS